MQSSLAYIDKTAERQIAKRQERAGTVSETVRSDLRKKATRPIAGFDVYDEAEEKRLLDEQIAKQRANLDAFINDRGAIRDKLNAAGITPLAIVPKGAWTVLCTRANLFMLHPDSTGQVRISHQAFDGLAKKVLWDEAADRARKDWSAWLKRLFPNNTDEGNYGAVATLVLPTPPADVIDVLLKASRANFQLKTAAVPEAISFRETVAQLRARETARREEEARRIEAMRRDPIIYTDHGSATAILAQFGDFPIEQELVDAVVEADDFIPEKPTEVQRMGLYGAGGAGGSGGSGGMWLSPSLDVSGLAQSQMAQLYQAQMLQSAAHQTRL